MAQLKHLEVDLQKHNTAFKIIETIAIYVDKFEELDSQFLIFLIQKIVPKIVKSVDFTQEFGSVFELACLKVDQIDFLVTMEQTLPQMVKDKKMKDLVEIALKNFFENTNWAYDLTMSEKADDEIITRIFKFKSIATNYLEGCPFFLIDKVYYSAVFKPVCALSTYL
jgi:hypothetical protein